MSHLSLVKKPVEASAKLTESIESFVEREVEKESPTAPTQVFKDIARQTQEAAERMENSAKKKLSVVLPKKGGQGTPPKKTEDLFAESQLATRQGQSKKTEESPKTELADLRHEVSRLATQVSNLKVTADKNAASLLNFGKRFDALESGIRASLNDLATQIGRNNESALAAERAASSVLRHVKEGNGALGALIKAFNKSIELSGAGPEIIESCHVDEVLIPYEEEDTVQPRIAHREPQAKNWADELAVRPPFNPQTASTSRRDEKAAVRYIAPEDKAGRKTPKKKVNMIV